MKNRDFCSLARRIQRNHMLVAGSFIIGLDIDEPGISERIAETAWIFSAHSYRHNLQ